MLKNLCLAAMLCLAAAQVPVIQSHEVANDPAHNVGEAVLGAMREELTRSQPAPAVGRRLRAQHDGPHPELDGKPSGPAVSTAASPAAAGPIKTSGGSTSAAQTAPVTTGSTTAPKASPTPTATATPAPASTPPPSAPKPASAASSNQTSSQSSKTATSTSTTTAPAPPAAGNVVPPNAGMLGGLGGVFGGLNPLTAAGTMAHTGHEAILGHTNTIKSPFMQQQEAGKSGGH